MIHRTPRWLAAAAAVAVLVELTGAAGWWSWRSALKRLDSAPGEGAAVLARSLWLGLPSAVKRSRRLPARALGLATDDAAVAALTVMSERQIRWIPGDPEGFKNRARARLIAGTFDDAAADLDRALERDPTSPVLQRLAALNERARGRNRATLEHLATAEGLAHGAGEGVVELTPEDAAWVRLEGLERRLAYYPRVRVKGVIALAQELRRRGEAVRAWELLEAESADLRVGIELARWELDGGLVAEAERRLDELLARTAVPAPIRAQAWGLTAMARDQRGDAEGALAAADRAISYDPRSPGPYLVLAGLAERRGELDQALGHLRRAWGMNPTDVGLLLRVASTAERAGELDDARLALERAVAVADHDPALRARLVEFHLRRGRLMDATLILSAALDRFPTDARLLTLAERLRAEVSRRGES